MLHTPDGCIYIICPKNCYNICGICGYNGKSLSFDLLVNILKRLEPHVGGKGTGLAFRIDNQIRVLRCKGKLRDFMEKFHKDTELAEIRKKGCLGIAHTRHPSSNFFLNEDRFSHTLSDCRRALALVHNGTLDPKKLYTDHKQIFDSHSFTTEKEGKILDSELLVHMIEHFNEAGNPLLDAIEKTFRIAKCYGRLKGHGMFAVVSEKEQKIYIAYGHHNENSLEIKRNQGGHYFYTVSKKSGNAVNETRQRPSDWNPNDRNQIIVISEDAVKFYHL